MRMEREERVDEQRKQDMLRYEQIRRDEAEAIERIRLSEVERNKEDKNRMDVRLNRIIKSVRHLLYILPCDHLGVLLWIKNLEEIIEVHRVDEDPRVPLASAFLNDKSRKIVANLTIQEKRITICSKKRYFVSSRLRLNHVLIHFVWPIVDLMKQLVSSRLD